MSALESIRMPRSACPYCGTGNDAAMQTTAGTQPKAGDPVVCIECTEIAVFNDDGSQRKPTQQEMEDFARNTNLRFVQGMVKSLRPRPPCRAPVLAEAPAAAPTHDLSWSWGPIFASPPNVPVPEPSPAPFSSGGGGEFSGAGASGDWASPSPAPEPPSPSPSPSSSD